MTLDKFFDKCVWKMAYEQREDNENLKKYFRRTRLNCYKCDGYNIMCDKYKTLKDIKNIQKIGYKI